ncbi:polysaccharide deacetylase family protein [Oscillibacter sp.]|uniref:polysaccharide deacetylase family protein n=1 Tax=Oscillibacter sp. TaxID=1945593 RepID=UPI0028992E45|nr:polysaccharide deacetylase family protein [Oscillibacter sp.]
MKQLAQGAFADSDLAEEQPHGKTVNFPGEMRAAERDDDGADLAPEEGLSPAEETGNGLAEEKAPQDRAHIFTGDGVSEAEDLPKAESASATEEPVDDVPEEGEAADGEPEAEPVEAPQGEEAFLPAEQMDAESDLTEREPYFGSVRFFKNMILAAVIAAIAIPSALAVSFWRNGQTALAEVEGQKAALSASLTELQTQYEQMAAEKLAQERIWAGSVADRVVKSDPLYYQELYPDFYVTEPLGPAVQDDGTMYLTFDDGPSSNTPLLLTVLRNKNVKATFFVVGGGTEKQRQWMRDIVSEGHTLGMHSYTHRYHEIYASVEAFLDDFYKQFTAIKEATGQAPTIFRFPGGSVNAYNYPVYREIVAEMLRRGFVFYDWNLSSGDASSNYISPKKITSNILDNAPTFSRGIVLLHDAPSKDSTVESLAGVIDGLRDQGFTLAPLTREVRPMLFNYTDYQPD